MHATQKRSSPGCRNSARGCPSCASTCAVSKHRSPRHRTLQACQRAQKVSSTRKIDTCWNMLGSAAAKLTYEVGVGLVGLQESILLQEGNQPGISSTCACQSRRQSAWHIEYMRVSVSVLHTDYTHPRRACGIFVIFLYTVMIFPYIFMIF